MNMMHTIKDWTNEHEWHFDGRELKQRANTMVHNPSFWLVIALLIFVAMMIFLSFFATGNVDESFPLYPRAIGWPYYYPLGR